MKTKLIFLCLLSILSAENLSAQILIKNIYYELDGNTATVCAGKTKYSGDVTIPESFTYRATSFQVTSIMSDAFSNCTDLTSVTIPNSVTSIGEHAFYGCTGLTSITLPGNIKSIENETFSNCTSLTSVTIPRSVASIGNDVFYDCTSLENVHISDIAAWCQISFSRYSSNPIYYAHNLYINGTKITDLNIPNGVTFIGSHAFSGCTGLTSVTIPNSVTTIEGDAFSGCSSLSSITIPSSVTSIGENAFYGCSGLTSITLPSKLTSIEDETFRGCSSLTTVSIPNSINSIGLYAFCSCTNLTFFDVATDNPNYCDLDGVLYDKNKKTLIQYPGGKRGAYSIPNSVRNIGDGAFYGCTGLTSITIPNSVSIIGNAVFAYCTSLTSVTIPNSITAIEGGMFCGCTSLTSFTISNNITFIDGSAFRGCTGLTSITIPNSVTSIASSAFRGCTGLTSITIPSSVTFVGDEAFADCNGLMSVALHSETFMTEMSSMLNIFGNQVKEYILGEEITSIRKNSFSNCTELKSITIPNSVTSIDSRAFYGCTGLTSITIPSGVISIKSDAFRNCSNLKSVTINSNALMSNSNSSFYWRNIFNNQIQEYILGPEITTIGSSSFSNCSAITSITIPNSVTEIGSSAFSGCTGLTSVTLPDGVKSIGNRAFDNCSNLTSINIPNSVTSIGDFVFEDCTSLSVVDNIRYADTYLITVLEKGLSSYTIKEGTKWIGNSAFSGCTSLASITIPNSVTNIENDAFSGCTGLTSVTIPNSVTTIEGDAFSGCSSLPSITIPSSVTSIGNSAFGSCTGLTAINVATDNPNYCEVDGVLFNKEETSLIQYPGGKQGAYSIPNSVKNIREYAFSGCIGSTTLTLPNGFTNIEDYSFYGFSGLTSITFPNSLTRIGKHAFSFCSSLTSITIPNSVTSIGSGTFSGCTGLTSVTILDGVTSIENDAFAYCTSITSVTLPNSIKKIETEVFFNCSSLIDIVIPNSVTSIGFKAFSGCTGLTSVTIPNSVTTIEGDAFSGCSSLPSITIPNSVTFIEGSAFDGCTNLTQVFLYPINPPSGGRPFDDRYVELFVPCAAKETYETSFFWKEFNYNVLPKPSISATTEMPERGTVNVPIIDDETCEAYIILTAIPNEGYHFVNWSNGITENPYNLELYQDTILTASFEINSYIVNMQVNNIEYGSVTEKSSAVFMETIEVTASPNYGYHFVQWDDGNTDNPRKITVKNDITLKAIFDKNIYGIQYKYDSILGTVIGTEADEYLSIVTFKASPNMGCHFIQWSDGVQDNPRAIKLTQDTIFIAEFGFDKNGVCGEDNKLEWKYDSQTNTLVISGNGALTSNYTYGAEAPIAMEKLIFNDGITNIGNSAFAAIKTLNSIVISQTITSIGDSAFRGCSELKSLIIPDNVQTMGKKAFGDCTALESVIIGNGLNLISENAFENCYGLRVLTLGEHLDKISAYAFYGCENLQTIYNYRPRPREPYSSSFDGVDKFSCVLYVPSGSLNMYKVAAYWKDFYMIREMGTGVESGEDVVNVTTTETTATFDWSGIDEAETYSLIIWADDDQQQVFCILTFNMDGYLINIDFGNHEKTEINAIQAKRMPAKTKSMSGLSFTVTGLEKKHKYLFEMDAINITQSIIDTKKGAFVTSDYENLENPIIKPYTTSKILRDNQLLILHGNNAYTITGQKVE